MGQRLDHLLASDAALELIAEGVGLAEGPVWSRNDDYLLFSDLAENSVLRWQSGKRAELFLKPAGYSGPEPFQGAYPGSNGLAIDSTGRLVLCEHGDRRITRLEADGRKAVLADHYRDKRLNSPNDLAFNSRGELYFTDPPFGLPKTFDDPRKELDFSGVYRLGTDGTLTLLTRALSAPNGIAFSPSERTIYISNSAVSQPPWMAYDVNSDGTLTNGRPFAAVPEWALHERGSPDGLKVDLAGNVFAAGPGGVHVFDRQGNHLGSIAITAPTNLAWGDDGSALYITSGRGVYRLQTRSKGTGF